MLNADRGSHVRFEEFERQARAEFERVPVEYRAGVDGLIIERRAQRHPRTADVYTLGECVTDDYPSAVGGPDVTRSFVVLYYGSFLRLSRLDDAFDWEEEIWETLTHELKHHLETLAAEDALADVDYAVDENFKRHEGLAFDPLFYRAGEPLGEGRYRLERSVFIERAVEAANGALEFALDDVVYRVNLPPATADVTFVTLSGDIDTALDELCVVLVRRAGLRGALSTLLRRHGPRVAETEAAVENKMMNDE